MGGLNIGKVPSCEKGMSSDAPITEKPTVAWSRYIADLDGDPEKTNELMMEALKRQFRPEFLNRIDDIISFNSLGREQIREIVEIQLGRIKERLADRNLGLKLNDGAEDLLAREGYDPAYGARPLKRAIQQLVLDPLAMRILKGEFGKGDTIEVGSRDGDITFRKATTAEKRQEEEA